MARTPVPVRVRLPLVVTSDGGLLDELLRLAAAGATEVELAPDPVAARSRFRAAPFVLIGVDQAKACLRAGLPRRPDVVLVGLAEPDSVVWQTAELLGAAHVAALPAAEGWLVERFSALHRPATAPGCTIAVLGGRGGAGASVLAASLAIVATRAGLRTLLVDADPLGGGLDLVLGWENLDGLRWPGFTGTSGRVDTPSMVEALPGRGDLVVLSWDRGELLELPPEAMAATVDAGRSGRDLTVLDLPRHLDDAAVLALQASDRAYLVVPAELRATAAAARVAALAVPNCPELSVVVRGPSPGRLKAVDVAKALSLPLAGTLRPEPGLPSALERGEAPATGGRGPLSDLCQLLIADLIEAAGERAA